MPPAADHAGFSSDPELILQVRSGDRAAFGTLYSRHAAAASTLARQFSRSAAEADDLVAEAFARVLDGMLAGKGPDTAFRAYLFTTVRNTAYDRTRKDKHLHFTDDMESHDHAVQGADPVLADLESGLIGKAFAGLPERWQTVLWHTQVEGQSAAEVALLLGLAPNAVSSLAFRAREGLREAYLQAHLADTAGQVCRTTVDRLGAWTRGGLSRREKSQVESHLTECDRCRALAAELAEINSGMRTLLAPLLLGAAAAGYLATTGPVVPLVQLGVLSGRQAATAGVRAATRGKVAAGGKLAAVGSKAAGGHAAFGLFTVGTWGPGAVIGAVSTAAAAAVAGVVIAVTTGHAVPPAHAGGPPLGAAVSRPAVPRPASPGTGSAGGHGGDVVGHSVEATAGPPGPAVPVATSGLRSPAHAGAPTVAPPTVAPPTVTARVAMPAGQIVVGTAAAKTTAAVVPPAVIAATSSSIAAGSADITSNASTASTSTGTTVGRPTLAAVGIDPAGVAFSSDLAAGGLGTLTVELTNTGGTASVGGQSLLVSAPAGITLTAPAPAPGLRRPSGVLASADPADVCVSAGPGPSTGSVTCTLPPIQVGASIEITLTVQADVTAADGSVTLSIDGGTTTDIPFWVPSGYDSATLTAHGIAPAAIDRVTLRAARKNGVTDAGSFSIPVAITPWLTVLADPTSPCAVAGGEVTCPSAAVSDGSGVVLIVRADAEATSTTVSLTAQDQRPDRHIPLTADLAVDTAGTGGYAGVSVGDAGRTMRAGTTTSIDLTGTTVGPAVVNPGPITVPVQLSDGLTVTAVPTGCTLMATIVVCNPVDDGPLSFALIAAVSPAATGPQEPARATVPMGAMTVTTVGDLTVDPILGGYDSILFDTTALEAGTTTTLILTGTPGPDVVTPGAVTIADDLGGGVRIVGSTSADCEVGMANTVCRPDDGPLPTAWTLTLRVADDAAPAVLALPTATLPGDRHLVTIAATDADLTIRAAVPADCQVPVEFSDGDFENPVVLAGAGRNETGSTAPPWQTTASDHQIEFWRDGGDATAANWGTPIRAQAGAQWVELDANRQSAIYQVVATRPGQQIRWTLWHRARRTTVRNGVDTMKVQIGGNSSTLVDQVPDGASGPLISDGPAAWVQYSGTYLVPAGQSSTRFQFAAVSSSSDNSRIGNFVDNISLRTLPCP